MLIENSKIAEALPPPAACDACGSKRIEKTTNGDQGKLDFADWPLLYRCLTCGASVCCHPNTEIPVGKMADSETRRLRVQVHLVFDPLWKTKLMGRSMAYRWAASILRIPSSQCHISWLTKEQLQILIPAATKFFSERAAIVGRRAEKRKKNHRKKLDAVKKHIQKRKRKILK